MMKNAQKWERCRVVPGPGMTLGTITVYGHKNEAGHRPVKAYMDGEKADTGTVVGVTWNSTYRRKTVHVKLDPPNFGTIKFRPGELERIEDDGEKAQEAS